METSLSAQSNLGNLTVNWHSQSHMAVSKSTQSKQGSYSDTQTTLTQYSQNKMFSMLKSIEKFDHTGTTSYAFITITYGCIYNDHIHE